MTHSRAAFSQLSLPGAVLRPGYGRCCASVYNPLMRQPSRLRFTAVSLFLLLLLAPTALAAETPPGELQFERWYVLRMQGQKIGHAHITEHRTEDDRVITANDTQMSLRRGPMTIHVTQSMRFTESADGEPIRADSRMNMGRMDVRKTLRFTENGIELTTRQAGRERTRTVAPPEQDWRPPAAAQRYVKQQLDEGAERIELRTMDPTIGPKPFTMTLRVVGEEDVEVMGKVVPAVVWEAEVSAMPGMQVREYVDARGRQVKTTMQVMPGMEVTMLEADKQLALSEADPPQILASMVVQPDGAVQNPRATRQATYEVRLGRDVDPARFNPPSTGYQRTAFGNERTARIVVDLDRPVAAGDDMPTDAHRAASTAVDHEDPKVAALVDEALGDEADALDDAEKAKRLRAFVHEYVQEKDLSVGFATASEVARTKQGDCTEHAVLLAALLRAADIPSRTATGLVYVQRFLDREGVFGGHMWTQAWLPVAEGGGRTWVDLDAALPGPGAFDAAHITLGTSSLSGDSIVNDLVAQAPLTGALSVKVIDGQ